MICRKNDEDSVAIACNCLMSGGVCILPTDTVYGFSGIVDLKNEASFKTDDRIRRIKGREESKPLIQLIAYPEDIRKYSDVPLPEKLLSKWPGSLTVIVPVKEDSPLADFQKTVAFRCPGDEWLRKVIAICGAPVYSTSVNRSGQKNLETEDEIVREFGSEADLVVLNGDTKGALPSTLVIIEGGKTKVLRQGSVVID